MSTCRTHPDRDSVFGNTYCGVPNPQVPHRHPYPTRFHGRVPYMPQSFFPYQVTPYAQAPFMGRARPMQPWEQMRGVGDGGGDTTLAVGLGLGVIAAGAALGAWLSTNKRGKSDPVRVAGGAVGGVGLGAIVVGTTIVVTAPKQGDG